MTYLALSPLLFRALCALVFAARTWRMVSRDDGLDPVHRRPRDPSGRAQAERNCGVC